MIGQNILELQKELSYMPMEKLVQLVGDPNSQYGSLTLIEIRNRQELENAGKLSNVSNTTVAEDVVSSAIPPAGDTSPLSSSTTDPSGGISQLPPQMMAEGGKINAYPSDTWGTPSPEEIRRARQLYPNASEEEILDIARGIDTSDITGYANGGITRLQSGKSIHPDLFFMNPDLNLKEGDLEKLKALIAEKERINQGIDERTTPAGRWWEGSMLNPFGSSSALQVNKQDILSLLPQDYDVRRRFVPGGLDKVSPEMYEAYKDYDLDPEGIAALIRESVINKGDTSVFEEYYGVKDDAGLQALLEQGAGLSVSKSTPGGDTYTTDKTNEILVQKEEEKKARKDEEINKNLLNQPKADPTTRIEALRESLGLQSSEDMKRYQEAMMLMGLGSSIAGATNLSDISAGIPSVAKTVMDMESARGKENIALHTAMNKSGGFDDLLKEGKFLSDAIAKADEQGYQAEFDKEGKPLNAMAEAKLKLDKIIYLLSAGQNQNSGLGSFSSSQQPLTFKNPSQISEA